MTLRTLARATAVSRSRASSPPSPRQPASCRRWPSLWGTRTRAPWTSSPPRRAISPALPPLTQPRGDGRRERPPACLAPVRLPARRSSCARRGALHSFSRARALRAGLGLGGRLEVVDDGDAERARGRRERFRRGFPGRRETAAFFPFATPPPFARRLVAARPAATRTFLFPFFAAARAAPALWPRGRPTATAAAPLCRRLFPSTAAPFCVTRSRRRRRSRCGALLRARRHRGIRSFVVFACFACFAFGGVWTCSRRGTRGTPVSRNFRRSGRFKKQR